MSSTGKCNGFATGTVISTPDGGRRIENLLPGDQVLGPDGTPVPVTQVYEPVRRQVMRFSYRDFSVGGPAEFFCTTNHTLSLTLCNTVPYVHGTRVRWFRMCGSVQPQSQRQYCNVPTVSAEDLEGYTIVRSQIAAYVCPHGNCGNIRHVEKRFGSLDEAQKAAALLVSESYHLIDPCKVFDGDRFEIFVDDFVNHSCSSKTVKATKIRLPGTSPSNAASSATDNVAGSGFNPRRDSRPFEVSDGGIRLVQPIDVNGSAFMLDHGAVVRD